MLLSLISMVYVGGLRFSAEYCFFGVKERKKIRFAKQGGKMFSTIIGKQLTDIYTVGFVYLFEEQCEFTPDLRWIYLEFEDQLLEFESIEQFSRLKIEKVSDIRYQFESDEDMIKVKSSIIEFALVASMLVKNTVKEIKLIDGTEKNCAAAKIILENGQIIFLDPGFVYGIGIGGREQEKHWYYNNR